MKFMQTMLFLAAAYLLAGCVTSEQGRIEEARELINSGKAECVIIKDGEIKHVEHGHGVLPLLNVLDWHPQDMFKGIVVDKVIGRAAAGIAICGKAKHVHGEVMSEDAVDFLRANQVGVSYTTLVPRILNRNRDGLCPLEKSVEGITDPAEALKALRLKVKSLQRAGVEPGGGFTIAGVGVRELLVMAGVALLLFGAVRIRDGVHRQCGAATPVADADDRTMEGRDKK